MTALTTPTSHPVRFAVPWVQAPMLLPRGLAAPESPASSAVRLDSSARGHAASVKLRTRSIRMMHLLERIAMRFNKAGVPLLVLKGAALNLTICDEPGERPMTDLDLLVLPEDTDRAFELLEELGGVRGAPMVREDFFPRFHYEMEYTIGHVHPVKIDLHVRPFRPIRYAQSVPTSALWERARTVKLGQAHVLIPSLEEMLIHLAVHSSIHGNRRSLWLSDLKRWSDAHRAAIDWNRFSSTVEAWRVGLAAREAFACAEREFGPLLPPAVDQRLNESPVSWSDRIVLWQAPRDHAHPVLHTAVNVACTPGWRFPLAYLLSVLLPGPEHMREWYCARHRGWLACAHFLRWTAPLLKLIPPLRRRLSRIETQPTRTNGTGVFATRRFRRGQLIARYHSRAVDNSGLYTVHEKDPTGTTELCKITGKLRFLKHCCRPTAVLVNCELRALGSVRRGQEITIDYGQDACDCRKHETSEGKTEGTVGRGQHFLNNWIRPARRQPA